MRVHIAQHIVDDTPVEFLTSLRNALQDSEVELSEGKKAPKQGAEVLVTKARLSEIESDLALCGKSLRLVYVPYAGPPEKLKQILNSTYPEVRLINSHHNANATAEFGIALMFAAAKLLVPADRAMRRGDWTPRGYPPDPGLPANPLQAVTLFGAKVCIVGFGAIGKRIANFCVALGMKVVATRRSISGDGEYETVNILGKNVSIFPAKSLKQALNNASVLIICCPATAHTKGMIGREEISCLSQDAILVNVGRGSVVDEDALFEALQIGASKLMSVKAGKQSADASAFKHMFEVNDETTSSHEITTKQPPKQTSGLLAAGIDTWWVRKYVSKFY